MYKHTIHSVSLVLFTSSLLTCCCCCCFSEIFYFISRCAPKIRSTLANSNRVDERSRKKKNYRSQWTVTFDQKSGCSKTNKLQLENNRKKNVLLFPFFLSSLPNRHYIVLLCIEHERRRNHEHVHLNHLRFPPPLLFFWICFAPIFFDKLFAWHCLTNNVFRNECVCRNGMCKK